MPLRHDCCRPGLVGHLHPHRESCIYGRTPIGTWNDPKPNLKHTILRSLSAQKRQGPPSPPGFGKLPYELLETIFHRLCGKEVAAVRLVSTEWEAASRPFFASLHLAKSVFWITSSQLDLLELLVQRFGEFMQELYIAADSFTISGISRAMKRYLKYRYSHVVASRYSEEAGGCREYSKSILAIRTTYIGQWFKKNEWHTYCDKANSRRFFWYYAVSILSQSYLRLSGKDVTRLASVLDRLPNCRIKVLNLSYEAYKLTTNVQAYGRAAPAHAFEMASYCSTREGEPHAISNKYAEHVLEEALTRRRLICSDLS